MLIGIDASRAVRSERTGTENYSLLLIRALCRQVGGHRLRLYCSEPPEEGLFPECERVEWRIMPFARLWTHVRLSLEMLLHPPDVLFVPAHVLPLCHPRASVVTVHDLGYLHFPAAHKRVSRWYLDWGTRYSARSARRVIVDSIATRNDLGCAYGVRQDKTVIAYPASTMGKVLALEADDLAEVQARLGTGDRYLLFLGTLQPRKNLESLIAAFRLLIVSGRVEDDVRLVLAGKAGWLSESILRAASAPELAGRVALTGYVAQEDVAPLLRGAMVFCYPSWYEGFGMPVLEAMRCRVPVVCSNTSSLPEVGQDAALQVDPGSVKAIADGIAAVLSDAELRVRMVARGLEVADSFSWDACARTVLETLVSAGRDG